MAFNNSGHKKMVQCKIIVNKNREYDKIYINKFKYIIHHDKYHK